MKAAVLSTLTAVGPAMAGFNTWAPPGPYDVRAPCPMLNTLANHNFLPHDGKDLTLPVVQNALFDALNINKTLASFLFEFALGTNPKPNATTFSLNDLGNHNILEHDASLSRSDAFFGNTLVFNQSVFDETKKYWGKKPKLLDLTMAAKARLGRIKTSQATNPEFTLSEVGDAFTFGEGMAYVVVFGDKHSGTVPRTQVEYLFEHEQFPLHMGWKKPRDVFQEADLDRFMTEIRNITEKLTKPRKPRDVSAGPVSHARRTATHWGF